MFRAQANPMDDAVVKATDENLINENWEFILDVCDRVSASPSGPQQAVASLIKRLAHRNANVQLYTLELANALSQNCGPTLHRELASRAFTEALLRLAADRNTHAQVKQKVLERMGTWTEEFGRAPEYGIMEQAYQKLRTSQPSLLPPSKPGKREISTEDRRKEDDELQMALALSVQETKAKVNGTASTEDNSNETADQASAGATQAQGTTAATVSRVRALYDFTPSEAGELAFRKNDIIAVLESVYKDWWKGSLRGQTGIFPLNYVEKLQDPTRGELERDAQMEAEVFGEIKNVEKLLALLSVRAEGGPGRRNDHEEDEISELYQRTLSIRPKLIELIGKYSQKKDNFTQLNEKFIKARRDYEALLDSSMAQPPQQYQQYPVRQHPAAPMYPQGHAPQYAAQQAPPAGYAPQAQPGYGAPYASSNQVPPQHLPQSQQDPTQRYYSPAPQTEPAQQQYAVSPYSPAAPPAGQGGPAAFHFIPGGVSGPTDQATAVRRKPSPQTLTQQPQGPPSEMGPAVAPSFPPQHTEFQGQIRPNSIHTLNSGNPQELATGGYESPVDNRRSYPPAAVLGPSSEPYTMQPSAAQSQGYQYPQYHQQQQRLPQQGSFPQQDVIASAIPAPLQPQSRNDLGSLPSRQRTESFESPSGLYSTQQQQPPPADQSAYSAAVPGQQSLPIHPSAPPPSIPGSPPPLQQQQQQPQGAYQPYQAYHPHAQPPALSSAPSAGDDPGDYYR